MRILSIFALLPAAALALEINTSTRAQLEQLPGLGVTTTERTLQARSERPLAVWNDLAARLSGIRGKRAEQLDRHGPTVNSRAHAERERRR